MALAAATHATWHPRIGACGAESGFRFEVWAPTRQRVELLLHPSSTRARRIPLTAMVDGAFAVTVTDVKAGDRYAYLLDGEGPFPDPASRYQPEGVHGPSQIIDPSQFAGRIMAGVVSGCRTRSSMSCTSERSHPRARSRE